MTRTIKNIDGKETVFTTDEAFIEHVVKIYAENEDEDPPYSSTIHWSPENVQQATEYIVEYTELELIED